MPRRTTATRILLARITCLLVRKTWVRSGIHLKIDASTYNIHKMKFSRLFVSGTYFFRPKRCQILKKGFTACPKLGNKKMFAFLAVISDEWNYFLSEWKIYPSQTFGRPKFPALMMFVSCLFVCVRISLLLLFFFSQCTRNREDDTRMGWTYSLLGCSDVKIL